MKTAVEFYEDRARGLYPADWDFRTYLDAHDKSVDEIIAGHEADRKRVWGDIFLEASGFGSNCISHREDYDGIIVTVSHARDQENNGEYWLAGEEVPLIEAAAREADLRLNRFRGRRELSLDELV